MFILEPVVRYTACWIEGINSSKKYKPTLVFQVAACLLMLISENLQAGTRFAYLMVLGRFLH